MFGNTGDLMNAVMASRIAVERTTPAPALEQRRAAAPGGATVASAFAAGWRRVHALVAAVLA